MAGVLGSSSHNKTWKIWTDGVIEIGGQNKRLRNVLDIGSQSKRLKNGADGVPVPLQSYCNHKYSVIRMRSLCVGSMAG